jgi:hypothetical protein
MKKILMLLLACTLVFSLTLAMTSCDVVNRLFGDDTTTETPDDNNNDNTGDNGGVDSDDTNILGGANMGSNGTIELPIVDVNSTDTTLPPEGAEEGGEQTTPDAE